MLWKIVKGRMKESAKPQIVISGLGDILGRHPIFENWIRGKEPAPGPSADKADAAADRPW